MRGNKKNQQQIKTMTRLTLTPAFVLHKKPYRNSSALVELITRDHGRISVVAKACSTPASKFRGLLRPFLPLRISASGRGELLTLSQAEAAAMEYSLDPVASACGFYLNELVLLLLQKHDPYEQIFLAYQEALVNLSDASNLEIPLRKFEKKLLKELGYALDLAVDQQNVPIKAENYYRYSSGYGLFPDINREGLSGADILAFLQDDYSNPSSIHAARKITRQALSHLLIGKKLKTRDYYLQLIKNEECKEK